MGLVDCAPRAAPEGAIHVDGGAAEGGDGTPERPLRTLSLALERSPGGLVVLAAGRYEAPAIAGVTVTGRCADAVTVEAGTLGAGAVLSRLTLDASIAPPTVTPGAEVRLTAVRVVGEAAGLVVAAGAEVRATPLALSGPGGGVEIAGEGHFECGRCLAEDAHGSSFRVQGSLVLRHTTVRGPGRRAIAGGAGGSILAEDLRVVGAAEAVHITDEARFVGERVFVEGGLHGVACANGAFEISDYAVARTGESELRLAGCEGVVRRITVDGRAPARGARAVGLSVGTGGVLDVSRAHLHQTTGVGLEVYEGTATVSQIAINGAQAAIEIRGGGWVEATGLHIDASTLTDVFLDGGDGRVAGARLIPGLQPDRASPFVSIIVNDEVRGAPSRLTLEDAEIVLEDGRALAIGVLDQCEVHATRLSVLAPGETPERTGIYVPDGVATVDGGFFEVPRIAAAATPAGAIELRDVAADTSRWAYDALDVFSGGRLAVERFELTAAGGPLGAAQGDGSHLEARRIHARRASNLAALDGATVTVEEALFEGPIGAAVAAVGSGSRIDARRVRVAGGRPAFGRGGFVALFAGDGAEVSAADLVIDGVNGIGVLARFATLEIAGLAVSSAQRVGTDPGEGVRVEQASLRGTDLRISNIEGPGLVVIDATVDVPRTALLDNEIGVLQRGENSLHTDPSRIAGNAVEDEICDQCSATPPEVPAPRPLPPL